MWAFSTVSMINVAVELYVHYNMKQHWNIPDFDEVDAFFK